MDIPLYKKMSEKMDLQIPGFLRTVPAGTVGQYVFKKRSSIQWYEEFRDRVYGSVGKSFLPVFRASDGEFYFSIGYRPPYPREGVNKAWHYFRTYLGALKVGRYPWVFRSGSPNYGWEEFSAFEWIELRRRFVSYLRSISTEGILAINFSITDPPFAEQYVKPFCDWMERNHIVLSDTNYYPFYFVYGLLNGPDKRYLFEGRRILVIISYDEQKKEAIASGLVKEGARNIQFLPVSRNKAMRDILNLESVKRPVDVVLIGAGVGASNILDQVRSLNTLCIDAGFCIECIADPAKRNNRVFCLPDVDV